MSQMKKRPRGTSVDPVQLGLVVERSAKARLKLMAERAGVSQAVMFEFVMEHMPIDARGLPESWPEVEEDGTLAIFAA